MNDDLAVISKDDGLNHYSSSIKIDNPMATLETK